MTPRSKCAARVQGCLIDDKLHRDADLRLDSIKQSTLRDHNEDMKKTIAELKDYIRVFLKELEMRQGHIERLEDAVRCLKSPDGAKLEWACAEAQTDAEPGDEVAEVRSPGVT